MRWCSQKHKKQLPEPIAKITASDPNPTSLANLIQRLEEKLDSKQIAIVKELGHSIGTTGMNLDDSCLLARITREELDNLCFLVPEVKIYLKLKQTEYKQKLLAVISDQALQNGDVKMSMWLYPILPKEPLPFFDHWRNHRPVMPWEGGKKVRKWHLIFVMSTCYSDPESRRS